MYGKGDSSNDNSHALINKHILENLVSIFSAGRAYSLVGRAALACDAVVCHDAEAGSAMTNGGITVFAFAIVQATRLEPKSPSRKNRAILLWSLHSLLDSGREEQPVQHYKVK